MAVASAADLLAALRQLAPCPAERLDGLAREGVEGWADAAALTAKLTQEGLLTPYQARQLLEGRGGELALGPYVLLEPLGEGGMGAVFRARHRRLGRVAAVKVIRKDRLRDAQAVRRFQREVRAAAQLSHPNIVLVYDADQVGDTHFMAMECREGTDLARLVKRQGPLAVASACEYVRQAALGLQHAFERGLVHRDVKPHNLLLIPGRDGAETVKLLDLGLARLAAPEEGVESPSTLTQEGVVMGTPDYLAPEQALGSHGVDVRADLYSLGCTFYFLLTGRVPFPGGTLGAKLLRHQLEEPTPVEQLRPDAPPGVAAVVRKLMAKRPDDRYQTPAELAAVLASGVPPPAAPAVAVAAPPPAAADTVGPSAAPTAAEPFALAGVTNPWPAPAAARKRGTPRRRLLWAVASFLLVGLVGVLLGLALGPGLHTDAGPTTTGPRKEFVNALGMTLALIPAGKFRMGSPAGKSNNTPQHEVEISRSFYLGAYPVTQEQYEKATGQDPSYFRPGGKGESNVQGQVTQRFPVECVSWDDAMAFCEALNRQDATRPAGWAYRLPTEAEWEYACRAGTTTDYSFGDDPAGLDGHAWFHDNAGGRPHPVGLRAANPWGLYDMHGNVWQWCADGPRTYVEGSFKDPKGPTNGDVRAIRGGSWSNQYLFCGSADRESSAASDRLPILGFRVCLSANP